MSKVKKYSRQLVVLFLVLATALTCMFAFTPEADAGATTYKWRVYYNLDQGNNNTENCYVQLYYKTNNGTGTESSIQIEGDGITFDKDKEGYYYWTSDSSVGAPSAGGSSRGTFSIPAGAFPTKAYVYVKCESGSPAYREFRIYDFTLQVLNQSGGVVATSNVGSVVISSSKNEQTGSSTVSIGTGSYPYVADWSITGTYPVYINRNGSAVSQNVTVSAVDNYGVDWVNAPSITGSNITVSNGNSKNPTLTFNNKSEDYTGGVTATWSTANSSKSSVSMSASTTVYASHSLTVNANGGSYSGANPITGNYTNEYVKLSTPTRTAYTFVSWTKTAGNGIVNDNNFTFGNNDATVSANWTPVQYTISPVYGGNSYNAISYNIETTSITLPTATRDGYTFGGWKVSVADGNWTVGESVSANPSGKYGNITVEPVWTPNSYTLNFNANKTGATVSPASKTVKFETAVGDLPVPSVTGYDFAGWFTSASAGTQVTADTVYPTVGNSTVYAHWTPTIYNITFNTDGGNNFDAIAYDIEDTSVELPVPVKTGYTFSHWIVEKQAGNWTTGVTVNGSLASNYGNVGLKAVYTPNKYTLNFNLNAAAGAVTEPECEKSSMTVTFDAAVGELPVPTLDGYDFAGWYQTATGESPVTDATVYTTADNSTIYASWTPVTYNIITDANGGNDIADGTYTIENGTIPAGGTRTGYTFSHWEVAADSGNWVAGETFNAGADVAGKYGDVTLKAVWTANKYTVTFVGNAPASSVSQPVLDKTSITVTYDSALNANEVLPVVTRDGYTFLGWFTQAEGGEKITTSTVYKIDGTTTYYAQWALVEYTLTFNTNNGAPIDPITYTVEDELTIPVATRDGYEFTNWFYSGVTTGSWVRNTSFTPDALSLGTGNWGSVELKANYTVIAFDITWVINGKTEVTTHPYNTYPTHEVPVIEDDPRYTYVFTGWDPAVAVVTGDATYTAVFKTTPKQYTVSWVADGETVHSQKVSYGDTIPTGVATVPAKTGHTGEWDYSDITTMPAEDITIEAVYTPINYTISWEAEGTVINTDSVAYGTLPVYTGETPVKAENAMYRYTFKGWTPEITTVTGDAIYVAEFTAIPKEYTITWIADGETVATHTVAYGSRITDIPEVPAKLGMVGSWAGVPETMPAQDITITANYVDGCLVTWYLDGTTTGAYYQLGFENGEQIAYDRADPTHPEDAEYTYTFLGWSETPDGELISGYPVAGSDDFTYFAVYSKTPKEYTITWVADGATVHSEVLAFGSDVDFVPELPAKTGHTGVWKNIPSTMPAQNVTVNAQYTPIDYTITWIVGSDVYPTIFAYGTMPEFTGVTYKPSTSTTDYTFAGWDKEITTVTGDETYTAQYKETARKYTVTWQYENGTVIDTFSVANGTAITEIPAIADKVGHSYYYELPEVMPADNVVIIVYYEANDYTITWVTPSGEVTETWKYGTTPVYSGSTPTKESTAEKDYTFAGWSPSVLTVTGDATYTAYFTETARRYSVVWFVDGEFYDARDIAFGATIPTLDVPQKPGYNGVWDTPFRTMPAHDVTINAVYNAKKYTIYWKVDGLTVYSASVAYGDAIPSKQVPEKVGCTGKWVDAPTTMPAENITINAVYTPNDYTITWRINGKEFTDTVTYGNEYVIELGGESIPDEIRVTIGGSVMSAESYFYDVGTGTLTIYGNAITGNIYVTARVSGGSYNIILNISNATMTNSSLVIDERTVYHTQIVPAAGYLLPATVDIFVDGMPVDGYTYNPANGKLTINAEVILGELEIAFDCPPDPDYDPNATPDEEPDTSECNCSCHSDNAFIRFFFNLATFFRKLFGMEQYRYCGCGKAHW